MLCMPLDEANTNGATDVMRALGLHGARAYGVQTRRGWCHHHCRPGRTTCRLAYDGHFGLAPVKLEEVAVIVLDLDLAHDVGPRELAAVRCAAADSIPADQGLDDWLRANRRACSKAARVRALCAPTVRLALERLRALGVEAVAESSPRGAHIVIRVDQLAECAELHALGRALVARLGDDLGPIEVFPTRDGRMCRAPLTGRARLLGPDGETLLHRLRADDRRTLLASILTPLVDLRAVCISKFYNILEPKDNSAMEPRSSIAKRFSKSTATDGHLKGEAYIEAVASAYDVGIGEGESWSVARRWSFALVVGLGLSVAAAVTAFTALLARDNHRARHCATRGGRQRLLNTFRSCARRHHRAVVSGDVTPRLRHPRILAIVAELCGKAVEVPAARTRARVTFASINDADPVRARIAASRARRADQAAHAARARHDAQEAPACPKHDDLFVNRSDRTLRTQLSLESSSSSPTAFSPPPTAISSSPKSGRGLTLLPRSSHLATTASKRQSRAPSGADPTSHATSPTSLRDFTPSWPPAPNAPSPPALEAAL